MRTARLLILTTIVLPAVAVAAQSPANSCPTENGAAELYGPQMSQADTGRVYSYTLSADGREFYFFKKVGDRRSEDYRIFRAVREGTGWSALQQLRLGVDASDLYPSLSADGSRLVFSSYRPVPGDTSAHPNAHIYVSRREGESWGTPELVRASRIGHYHSGLQQDASGTLTFRVTTPDWRSATDMMVAWDGRALAAAMTEAPIKPALRYWQGLSGDSMHVWGAIMAPNGAALLPISRVTQPGGRRGPSRYFVSAPQPDGGWSPLVPAGGGLDAGSPNFAWFSADGCWLHYTRDYSQLMRVASAVVLNTAG